MFIVGVFVNVYCVDIQELFFVLDVIFVVLGKVGVVVVDNGYFS